MSSTVWRLSTRTEPPVQLKWNMSLEEIGEKLTPVPFSAGLRDFQISGNFVLTDHYVQKIVKLFEGTDVNKQQFNELLEYLVQHRWMLTELRITREVGDFYILTDFYHAIGSCSNHYPIITNIKQYYN